MLDVGKRKDESSRIVEEIDAARQHPFVVVEAFGDFALGVVDGWNTD